MTQACEPKEDEGRRDIINAIRTIDCLSELVSETCNHFDYELDLEVVVYGHNYNGKKVGPYVRLLTYPPGATIIKKGDPAVNKFYIIVEGYVEVYKGDSERREDADLALPAGEMFGATSVLVGGHCLTTVKVPPDGNVKVLEVKRPAIRLLRKLPKFADKIDKFYRVYGKAAAIDELIKKRGINPDLRRDIENVSSFRVLSKGQLLFNEGTWIGQLFLITEGWVCRSVKPDSKGAQARDFLGKGYCLGLEGVTENVRYPYTAIVASRAEVLEINVIMLRRNPDLKSAFLSELKKLGPLGLKAADVNPDPPVRKKELAAQGDLINTGLVDATNLLVMDMDLCVRCGNCSMACHKVHGRSRLVRRGIHITRFKESERKTVQSVLAPAVCMHCKDPECLTGCPTGAISRMDKGQIDINPGTCIGCGDCATQCPYDAISMVPRNERARKLWDRLWPRSLPDFDLREDLLAIKCNLCDGTKLNPEGSKTVAYSCEENCPTGALVRIVPDEYFTEIRNIKNLKMVDQTHAYGRNIHKSDPKKRLIHKIAIPSLIVITALIIFLLTQYGYGARVLGLVNMRWVTGLASFVGIAATMSYWARRRVYDKRRGPLRYWMLAHSYLGVLSCVIVLLHAGTGTGGLLTTSLAVAFDLVIVTGLFGLACYLVIPRLLTSIEGTPLLIEDLIRRRGELEHRLAEMPGPVGKLVRKKVVRHFKTFRFLLRQYRKRESIATIIDSAIKKFEAVARDMSKEDREIFNDAVTAAATLPRVNALIYLHRLVKMWLVPHLIIACLMLVMMVVHIIQVFYASW